MIGDVFDWWCHWLVMSLIGDVIGGVIDWRRKWFVMKLVGDVIDLAQDFSKIIWNSPDSAEGDPRAAPCVPNAAQGSNSWKVTWRPSRWASKAPPVFIFSFATIVANPLIRPCPHNQMFPRATPLPRTSMCLPLFKMAPSQSSVNCKMGRGGGSADKSFKSGGFLSGMACNLRPIAWFMAWFVYLNDVNHLSSVYENKPPCKNHSNRSQTTA